MLYKVFVQAHDHTFVEIAQTTRETDADWLLDRYESGMVTKGGQVVTTKNLTSPEQDPALFSLEGN